MTLQGERDVVDLLERILRRLVRLEEHVCGPAPKVVVPVGTTKDLVTLVRTNHWPEPRVEPAEEDPLPPSSRAVPQAWRKG